MFLENVHSQAGHGPHISYGRFVPEQGNEKTLTMSLSVVHSRLIVPTINARTAFFSSSLGMCRDLSDYFQGAGFGVISDMAISFQEPPVSLPQQTLDHISSPGKCHVPCASPPVPQSGSRKFRLALVELSFDTAKSSEE